MDIDDDGLVAEKLVEMGIEPAQAASDLDLSDSAPSEQDLELGETPLFVGNPAMPLDEKTEQFLALCMTTKRQGVAYQSAISGRGTLKTATQQASRLLRRPEVRARLQWLYSEKKRQILGRPAGVRMNKEAKLQFLETIIETGSPSDRIAAMKEHNRLTGDGEPQDATIPDPAYLAEHMRKAAELGVDPVELAKRSRPAAS